MPSIEGVRERARAEITAEIVAEARRQLSSVGAGGLSLRAVARELGMVSSGIYRYVANRDALLTLLIIDAYDALGADAEEASRRSGRRSPAKRWLAVAQAIRSWAVSNPHEYALIYGSPVPGYEAPHDTVGPATRVTLALVGVVVDAQKSGRLETESARPAVAMAPPSGKLRADLDAVMGDLEIELPSETVVRMLAAWTQLFGMISFELFGQTRNVITAHEDLFDTATMAMAAFIGLTA